MGERLLNGVLGDFVESHSADTTVRQQLALFQQFQHMPGDCLPFTIRIGCENNLGCALQRLGYGIERPGGTVADFPLHREVLIGLHRPVFGRQIAYMAIAGDHGVIASEVFVDRLGFGR